MFRSATRPVLFICLAILARDSITGAPALIGGTCSGFFVDETHVVTCGHCVLRDATFEIVRGTVKTNAQVVFVDTNLDIAVLTCAIPDVKPLQLGDSDSLRLLDDLYVFGFPLASMLGLELSASQGKLDARRSAFGKNWLQLDAVINPGNSGGPIVDKQGQVVGVAVAKLKPLRVTEKSSLIPERINFAIPSSTLRARLTEAKVPFSTDGTNRSNEDVFATVREATVLLLINPKKLGTAEGPTPPKKESASANKVSVKVTIARELRGELTTVFTPHTEKIYALFKTIGAKSGDKIRGVLIAEDVGDVAPKNTTVLETKIDMEGDTESGDFNFTKPTNGWPVGKYRVDIYLNDELVTAAKFTVKAGSKSSKTDEEKESSSG